MINSVGALCRALNTSLRHEVLPKLEDSFARGQLAAVMYVLNNLERQAAWSQELLGRHANDAESAIAQVRSACAALALTPPAAAPQAVRDSNNEARRDAANAEICALLDWFSGLEMEGAMTPELRALRARLLDSAVQAVQEEKRLVPPSMMREMSGD
ncbi:hypothetical protein SRS16P2_00189 (plasmid) [Variovorax sp. SRS16]|uniref:hypothetical protein n=1 Tax=Variovorax sp. SRS16 TaxID=282217 RepID=UPI00131633F6|nr:hypothetical protein [Variovorax sp. SRS16]VTU45520.1 hypothetical protein SRS16P2_00189 [Variovorax sp. SRS16]